MQNHFIAKIVCSIQECSSLATTLAISSLSVFGEVTLRSWNVVFMSRRDKPKGENGLVTSLIVFRCNIFFSSRKTSEDRDFAVHFPFAKVRDNYNSRSLQKDHLKYSQ